MLWTTKPVRIDPKRQELPRAPDRVSPYPDTMYVPPSVRVPNSVTFQVKGTVYRLAVLEPVPPQMVCREASGQRWACGLRARMNLRAMIAGKQIACRRIGVAADDGRPPEAAPKADPGPVLVDCVRGVDRIALDLLRSGSAVAARDLGGDLGDLAADLATAEAFARDLRAGIWSDAATAAR
ncbi:thermonuclease family protein [Polymorphum gilvum]|uniref:thermonuclease family protein n=1 Tax=Polymorphum gilvum TaxID=991904 RepID=UPI0011D21114|nr:hypothetical protein [Polymorphum gilvum]